MEKLSVVLKKLRESKDVTILKLSEISGVGNGTIGDIERGKSNGSKKSLEKIAKALNLTTKEKDELYTAFLGREINKETDERILALNKRELSQYEKTMEEASLFFNDETVSDEDKQKMLLAMNELFFESKQMNKEKYKKNKKDNNE